MCHEVYPESSTHEGEELTSLKTADGSKDARRSVDSMQVNPGLLRQGGGSPGSGLVSALSCPTIGLPQASLEKVAVRSCSFLSLHFGPSGCRGLSCPDQTVHPQMIATPNHDRRPLWK